MFVLIAASTNLLPYKKQREPMVVIPLSAIAAMRNYPIRIAGSRNREFRATSPDSSARAAARELTPLPPRYTSVVGSLAYPFSAQGI